MPLDDVDLAPGNSDDVDGGIAQFFGSLPDLPERDPQDWDGETGSEKKPPFQSVQGMLPGEFGDLEAEIANMCREAWRNFPRDIPPEENP